MTSPTETTIHGHCDPRFEAVRNEFVRNFSDRHESGAAVAVRIDGELVVDLWGGMADHRQARPWTRDSVQLVFSTTKGLAAACALLLWQWGQLDIDAPVASYWPAFGAAGKERITARHLMTHQAGLAAFTERVSVEDCHRPGWAAAQLATQTPDWEPGSAHGYHALTYGWLLGEVVARASGRSLGAFLAEEIAGPLGAEAWIGLPPALEPRVSRLTSVASSSVPDQSLEAFNQALMTKGSLTRRVFSNPSQQQGVFNEPALHAAEWPAANGIATATGLARIYEAMVSGELLSAATVEAARTPQSTGMDLVLQRDTCFGLGFMLPNASSIMRGGGFGHPGAGGSLAFGDCRTGISFAYVMSAMDHGHTNDPRCRALVDAAYASL